VAASNWTRLPATFLCLTHDYHDCCCRLSSRNGNRKGNKKLTKKKNKGQSTIDCTVISSSDNCQRRFRFTPDILTIYISIYFAAHCETHATSSSCSMSNSLFGLAFGHIGRRRPRWWRSSFSDGLRKLFTRTTNDDNNKVRRVQIETQTKVRASSPQREWKKREKYP